MKTRETITVLPATVESDAYRTVVEDLTELVCRFLPDSRYTFVNDVFCRFFGKRREELIGHPWQMVALEEDLPAIQTKLSTLNVANPVVVIDGRVLDADGQVRSMQFINRGLFDAQGRLVETQSVGRDVTERMLVEQRLQEGNERWKFALESSGFGVWDWDVASDQIFYSKQFKKMLGHGDHDAMEGGANGWQNLVHPDDLPGTLTEAGEHLAGRIDMLFREIRMRCKEGSWKWVLARGKVVRRDLGGVAQRMIGTIADISKRKTAEAREAHSLQLIAEGAPSTAVLEAITRNVEAGYPGMRCSIMLADTAGDRLQIKTAPNLPDFVKEAIDGMPIAQNSGCCGTAAYSGMRVISTDIFADAHMEPFFKLAMKANLRACWSEPIVSSLGKVLGTLACYHSEPHNPSQPEIQAVVTAARLAALAIEREWKEQALGLSEERYSRALRGTTDGLWDWNLMTGDVYFSPRWKQMLGFAESELPSTREGSFLSRLHPDDVPKVHAARKAHFEQRTPYYVEFRLRTKAGDYKWFLARGQADWNELGEAVRMTGTISDITDRVLAEKQLVESEARYRRIVETSDEGIWVIDAQTRTTFANSRMARMLGYSVDEMMGLPLDAFMDEEGCIISAENVRRRQSGITEQHDFKFLRKDGVAVWTLMSTNPILDDEGAYAGALAMVTDITERKRADFALAVSEAGFRAVFEQAAVGVAIIETATGRYLSVNDRMCLINQRTREQMLKLSFMDVTFPDDLQDDLNQMKDLKAGLISSFAMEKRNISHDGSLTWIHLTVSPMWKPGEPPLRHVAVVTDISERKLAEQRYLSELAYTQALVSYTAAFILVLDVHGRFVHANAAFFTTMGYEESDVIGKTPWEIHLMEKQEVPRSKERFKRLLGGDVNPQADVRLRTKSGEWRVLELRSTSTRKPDGSPDRIVITGTDVTERNRLQHEVLRVVEQEQARVGHDLHDGVGQTMTGIVSLVEALEADLSGDTKAQAQRIQELLRVSVAEVRRMSHGLSPTSIKFRGLGGALKLLAETVRTNFRTICLCEVDDSIARHDNDKEAHLFRIAQEAVNNALRHGKPNMVKISLQEIAPGECELRIENDGAALKKSASSKGSGIGMRVMQYRANLIGARIKIESKPRHGVIVTCSFESVAVKKAANAPKKRKGSYKPKA